MSKQGAGAETHHRDGTSMAHMLLRLRLTPTHRVPGWRVFPSHPQLWAQGHWGLPDLFPAWQGTPIHTVPPPQGT